MKTLLPIGVIMATVIVLNFIAAPFLFPRGEVIVIREGLSITEAARLLEEENVIRSSAVFSALAKITGDERGVVAGAYQFKRPLSVVGVWYRLWHGDTGLPLIKVTIPEGAASWEIANILERSLSSFDVERFKTLAREHEGYLFPETYFFSDGISPERVIDIMRVEFDKNTAPLAEELASSGRTLRETVIMASLLEKEARRFDTRSTVAGILWKRLDRGMPLQVDAVFGYIYSTKTFSPTFDQLSIDSPYNTYTNAGLPPGPIANPGLDSLKAALNQIETPYFYYLTGADGTMHYARTFDEHVANRRYLR